MKQDSLVPKLLVRSQIEDAKWDLFIQKSTQRVVYGYSWYLDIVCEDWHALVLYSGDDFQVVMPLPVRRKLGFKVLQQPLFCQYLGLFSQFDLTNEIANAFLRALCAYFSYISSYSFHPQNFEAIYPLLSKFPKIKFNQNHTFWLDLNQSIEAIQSRYSTKRNLNLNQSEKFGWDVLNSRDLNPIIDLFRSHHASKIDGGVNEKAYILLEKVFKRLLEKQKAELWYARAGEDIHAGCLFVKESDTAIYLFNSADETGRKGNARTYLLNKYFEKNAGEIKCFDFESPEIASIASFYEQFGADKMPYITIRKNDLPFALKQFQKLRLRLLVKTKQDPFADPCRI